jgi:hypothetical protein
MGEAMQNRNNSMLARDPRRFGGEEGLELWRRGVKPDELPGGSVVVEVH